jgi:predicted O-methyltransferase YrrM
MDPAVLGVLSDYEKRAQDEWRVMSALPEAEVMTRLDEFLIFVGPDTGKLMHMLAVSSQAKVIVEVGASYGYSTVWLADAARTTGGKVHSLELSQEKVEYGRAQLKRAGGLDAYVEFHVGDARETLARLSGPFDFVLIDLWKNLYIPCFELAHPKLAEGAFIVADNMTVPKSELAHARAYQELVHKQRDLDSVMLPIGSGVELSRKISRA